MQSGLVLGPTRLRLSCMLVVRMVLSRQVRQCGCRNDHVRVRACCSRSSVCLFRTLVLRRALRNLQALITSSSGVVIGCHGLLRGVHRVLSAHRVRVE